MSTVSVFYHRPRRTFYARVYIPLFIQHFFHGRIQCWRSLGTKDKRLAHVKAALWNSRLQRLFYTLATKGHAMDVGQIEALINRWMFTTLEAFEEDRCDRLPRMDDNEVEDQWYGLSTAFDEAHGALIAGDYGSVREEVDELLSSSKMALLDPSSPAYGRLARELLKAKQRVFQVEMERWSGDYSTPIAPVGSSSIPTAAPATAVPQVSTKAFSEVSQLYLKEHHTRQARTQGMIEATFKTFLRVIGGDKPIGDITKADCRAFKESMVSAYRKAETINKHLHFLDHLFRWAKGQGFVADSVVNPVAGLRIAKSIQKKEALKRLAFTREERETLIAHPSFQRQRDRSRHPERYWIVLLCLYAGLRREEAAQLLVSQVVHDAASGVWYFDISDQGEGQSLKNAASKRRVPLHADLTARLGFLDYVDRTKTVGHTRLFYQCAWSANGWGDATGKWFGRLVRGTLKFPPSLVLHSFRHGFITGLHSAGVPDALVYALCGHTGAGGEVHAMYTHRESFPLKVLSEAVNKLDFGLV